MNTEDPAKEWVEAYLKANGRETSNEVARLMELAFRAGAESRGDEVMASYHEGYDDGRRNSDLDW